MPVKGELKHGNVPVKLWTSIAETESSALTQLSNISKLPYVFKHVAAMPDVHVGYGATVGSVIASKSMVIPAAVGVDIGCGMMAYKTDLVKEKVEDKLDLIRMRIEKEIPLGPDGNTKITRTVEDWKGWRRFEDLNVLDFQKKTKKCKDRKLYRKALSQLGSLGGGNHFIEVCLDTEDNVWVMLHSGSRNVGKVLAERHMNIAKKLIKKHEENIPDADLAYFLENEDEFQAYWHDLKWAQDYAYQNRIEMMNRVMAVLSKTVHDKRNIKVSMDVNCHHNYVAHENHFGEDVYVTRKGAVSAQEGQYGIIPGSMGAKSYVVKGKGNADSFCSCSHGAGRKMSRSQARRQFTVDDLVEQTKGVECRKDHTVLDEIPGAYKDIDEVMANQTDLVDVVAQLKQIMCVKG